MRTFYIDLETDEGWERYGREIKVKSNTINGAIKRSWKKGRKKDENIYQICTRISGCSLPQPVFDFMNGNMSKWYGLNL